MVLMGFFFYIGNLTNHMLRHCEGMGTTQSSNTA